MTDDLARFVKDYDRHLYWSVLFAPVAHRQALITLYAFAIEMKRIRFLISEPGLGIIRLEWWREGLDGSRDQEFSNVGLGAALRDLFSRYPLSRAPFLSLIDARAEEIESHGFAEKPDEATIENYCGACHAVLIHLATLILNDGEDVGLSDVSGHAGMVLGLIEALREDRLALSRQDLATLAREHLIKMRGALHAVPENIRAAYLPLVVAEPFLNTAHLTMDRLNFYEPSALSILWRMVRFKL